jgi:DNA excision repair protein ERCC-1
LYASVNQRGNSIMNYIRNVPYQHVRMVPDFMWNTTKCALFLSLKFNSLNGNYIHGRIAEVRSDFTLRILLVLVDMQDSANALVTLNRLAVLHQWTLILAWSEEEAARYLETFKALDGKEPTSIQKPQTSNWYDQANAVLTTVKSLHSAESGHLLANFGSIQSIASAPREKLTMVQGLGAIKVERLYDAWHLPFSKKAARERKRKRELQALQDAAAAASKDGGVAVNGDAEEEEEVQDSEITALKEVASADGVGDAKVAEITEKPTADNSDSTLQETAEKDQSTKDDERKNQSDTTEADLPVPNEAQDNDSDAKVAGTASDGNSKGKLQGVD